MHLQTTINVTYRKLAIVQPSTNLKVINKEHSITTTTNKSHSTFVLALKFQATVRSKESGS